MWYGISYLIGVLNGCGIAFIVVRITRCDNCCQVHYDATEGSNS